MGFSGRGLVSCGQPGRWSSARGSAAWYPRFCWPSAVSRSPSSSAPPTPGGKMRRIGSGRRRGRRAADRLHHALGVRRNLRRRRRHAERPPHVRPAAILARHAWGADERLDLFADLERSADAIGDFAGAAEAEGYRAFCDARPAHLRDTRDDLHPRAAAEPRGAGRGRRPAPASAICGRSVRSPRCGRRSASISRIRACASCSAATPPIAARRRSSRRPR